MTAFEIYEILKELKEKYGNPIPLRNIYEELKKRGYSKWQVRASLKKLNNWKIKVKDFVSVELVEE